MKKIEAKDFILPLLIGIIIFCGERYFDHVILKSAQRIEIKIRMLEINGALTNYCGNNRDKEKFIVKADEFKNFYYGTSVLLNDADLDTLKSRAESRINILLDKHNNEMNTTCDELKAILFDMNEIIRNSLK